MRQFLAIELPDFARARLGSLQAALRERNPGWRWVRAETIHLTVRFLGEVSAELDAATRPVWRGAAAEVEPFTLRMGEVGRFPPRGRPRTLWVGACEVGAEGRLAALAAGVEHAARGTGFEPESRPFLAHVTLARADRSGRATDPGDVPYEDADSFNVTELVLFRSELGPTGARYTALERFVLGRSPTGGAKAGLVGGPGPRRQA